MEARPGIWSASSTTKFCLLHLHKKITTSEFDCAFSAIYYNEEDHSFIHRKLNIDSSSSDFLSTQHVAM
jgi:hypothetical protein